ncbi:MAG: beta-ketoacyl-ACP synthase II [Anaerolineae bacterium]
MTRRVVITGLGMVISLGHTVESAWEAVKAGECRIDRISRYDPSHDQVQIAAEIRDWNEEQYVTKKDLRRFDRYQVYAYAAACQALQQAGWDTENMTPEMRNRTSVIVGSSVGGIESFDEQSKMVQETGDLRKVTPFGIPKLMVNGGANKISIMMGAHGPSYTPTSACATGADCIGHAYDLIRIGRIDQALAGAGDAPIIPLGIAAFDRVGAMSRLNDTPRTAVRPFARDRAGLVFAEGAGVIVLEEYEMAKARGAPILAELVGYAATSDAFHLTAPSPDGIGASNAIRMAMDVAQINPEQIDYINAHGTATDLNDVMETVAIKRALGEHAYKVPMSSTKSMTGHGMGMTAAIEAIFSVLALRDQVAPPTINLDEPDPDCDLDYVPHTARDVRMTYTMSNSFGFGGHNSSLIFKKI